jgi:hypothetical protein
MSCAALEFPKGFYWGTATSSWFREAATHNAVV